MSDLARALRSNAAYLPDQLGGKTKRDLMLDAADRIATLERDLAAANKRAEKAEQELWLTTARAYSLLEFVPGDTKLGWLRDLAAPIEAERTARLALEADNAALVRAVQFYTAQFKSGRLADQRVQFLREVLSTHGHSGAALLKRVERLEKAVHFAHEAGFNWPADPFAANPPETPP